MTRFNAIAIALCLALPMSACSTAEGAAVSLSHTTTAQASTVKAAGEMYVLATKAATAYLNSGHATKDVERQMVVVENQIYMALNQARAADKAGNSPAVAASLALFNANYSKLATIIPGLS